MTGRPLSRASGFTLIELLVVIAIIAILAALLMPALERARGTARITVCVSQQHQMMLAFQTYIVDCRDYPPYTFTGYDYANWWTSTGVSMWQVVVPALVSSGYLGTDTVAYCTESAKAQTGGRVWPGWMWRPNHDTGQNRGDYLYTGPGVHPRYWYGAELSPKLTEKEFPGMWDWGGVHADGKVLKSDGTRNDTWSGKRVPLLGDSKWTNWTLHAAPHFPVSGDAWNYDLSKGQMNFLFSDGSARTYPYSY